MNGVGEPSPTGSVGCQRSLVLLVGVERMESREILHRHDGADLAAMASEDNALAPKGHVGQHVTDAFAHRGDRDSTHPGSSFNTFRRVEAVCTRARFLYETDGESCEFTLDPAAVAWRLPSWRSAPRPVI